MHDVWNSKLNANSADGDVVHSYGRLIPHEFPITDLQQISGPDGIGRITCTVSSETARFAVNGGVLETGGVTQTRNASKTTLVVNPSNVDSFQNRDLYCTNIGINFLYLFISSASKYNCISTQKQPVIRTIQVLLYITSETLLIRCNDDISLVIYKLVYLS